MNKTAKQRKKKLNRKQFLVLVIMLSVMLIMLISFAWYYFKVDKEVDSEEADVMAPYYLYMLDGEGNSLSLSIGSLHPGETKQVVIGVSNKPASGDADYLVGKNSSFDYKMALAYTQNLPITYKVYELLKTENADPEFTVKEPSGEVVELEKNEMSKDEEKSNELTEENNTEMYQDEAEVKAGKSVNEIVNYVQYDLYPYDSGSAGDSDESKTTLSLKTVVDNNGTTSYEMDYYLIEMEWKDEIEFSNFIKETDLIYVIVDAVQPEPEAQAESGT